MSKQNRYKAWWQMLHRCHDPNHPRYEDYGGRGITVDPAWHDFETYYADTGEPPTSKHSVDRVDNDGPYGPGNWRWATKTEQSSNRRDTHLLTYDGKTMSASEWARELGVKPHTILWRVKKGWPVERVLSSHHAYGGKLSQG